MPVRRRGNRGSRRTSDADVATGALPTRPPRGIVRSAAGLKPSLEEVLLAVRSLYDDQMKPFGRILRKRVAERAALAAGQDIRGAGVKLPDIDVEHLQTVCSNCPLLEVHPEEAGDWSAILVDVAEPFIDIFGNDDPYPEEVWAEAKSYFGSLNKDDMQLPGGRYTCAQLLMDRDLPFLKNFTLGKVCHFIQIAISKRKLLGYSDGSIVPWAHSMSMVKETRAAESAAPENQEGAGLPLATWETAKTSLKALLAGLEAPTAKKHDETRAVVTLPLSNLKRLLRQRCEVELSETALGYSKLSDLLQDSRFEDVCRVELQGVGYVVMAAQAQALPESPTEPSMPENEEDRWFAAALVETTQLRPSDDSDEEIEDRPTGVPGAAFARRTNFGVSLDEEPTVGPTKSLPMVTPLLSPGIPSSTFLRKWGQLEWPKDNATPTATANDPLAPPTSNPVAPPTSIPLARASVSENPDPELQAFYQKMHENLSTPLRSPGTGFSWNPVNEMLARARPAFCAGEPLDFESAGMSPAECVGTPFPSPGIPTSTIRRSWGPDRFLPMAAGLPCLAPTQNLAGETQAALRLRQLEVAEQETAEGSGSFRFESGTSSSSRSTPPTPETYTSANVLVGKAMSVPTDAGHSQSLGNSNSSSSNNNNSSSNTCSSIAPPPTFGCPPLSLEPEWTMFGTSSLTSPSWPSSAKSAGGALGLCKLKNSNNNNSNNNSNNSNVNRFGLTAATPTEMPPGLTTVPPTPQSPLYMASNLRAF